MILEKLGRIPVLQRGTGGHDFGGIDLLVSGL
jgi:hypothetical protein